MKDYSDWNHKKEQLEEKSYLPDFTEREVWWCSIGLNIGQEEDGKNEEFERPVLILRKFNKEIFLGLPLTSIKKKSSFYFPVTIHGQDGSIILSQARLLSTKRLRRRLARLGKTVLKEIREQYKKLIP